MPSVSNLLSVDSYGDYTGAYGTHTLIVEVCGHTFWFSYDSLIAYRDREGMIVSENVWGPTTGKHLRFIDRGDKRHRLDRDKFLALVEERTELLKELLACDWKSVLLRARIEEGGKGEA